MKCRHCGTEIELFTAMRDSGKFEPRWMHVQSMSRACHGLLAEPVEYPSSPQVDREQMLQDLALQLDLALGELRLIDEAFARRPALDDLGPKQRYEKIMRMCQFAGLGHDKAKQVELPVGSEVKPRTGGKS